MKIRLALALPALLAAVSLVVWHVRERDLPIPQPDTSPSESSRPSLGSPSPATTPSKPAGGSTETSAENLSQDLHPFQTEFESALPKRFGLSALQSTHDGYVADLLVDGLPLLGARYYARNSAEAAPTFLIQPDIGEGVEERSHGRALRSEAEAQAQEDATRLSECEIFSIARAREVWFNVGDRGIYPAYAIEVFYRCERDTRREDWIYRDPDLDRIGTLRKR